MSNIPARERPPSSNTHIWVITCRILSKGWNDQNKHMETGMIILILSVRFTIYLTLRYCPRRNRSIRFIYCINFSVVPIIHSLKNLQPNKSKLYQCDSPINSIWQNFTFNKMSLLVYILSGMGQTSSCTKLIYQHPQNSNENFLPEIIADWEHWQVASTQIYESILWTM